MAAIKCLSEEVQAKLRSGIAIFSLQQCVEELMLNSIDAGATCVCVRIDMVALKIQVIDNGVGMNLEDMENVGNRYFTSKCSSIEDLENLKFYGFRGEAVASIVSLATLVEITSRTKSSLKTHVKVFKNGKGLNVFEAEASRPSAGTTFVVCNFFHNMPVRRKRIDAVLEGERIRQRVEAISLMHPSVSITLKNDCTGAMLVQVPKARDTYHRFIQIHGLGRAQKCGEIIHNHGQFNITGYLGKEGHYNSSLQFLFVNDRLVLKTRIHKLLNLLLRKMSSLNLMNDSPDLPSATRSPKQKKGQDLQGMYIINIKCPYSEYDICFEPSKTLIEFKDWDGILLCVEEAMKEFLNKENLVAELSPEDLEYASQKVFSTAGAEQQGDLSHQGIQATTGDVSPECSIGMTPASEAGSRKLTGNLAHKEMDGQMVDDSKCAEEEEQGLKANSTGERELDLKENVRTNRDLITISRGLVPMPKNDMTIEKVLNSCDTQIESQSGQCLPCFDSGSESRQLGIIEDINEEVTVSEEMRINISTASSRIDRPHGITQEVQRGPNCLEQILPHHPCGNKHIPLSAGHRKKISLSDPYIHESLQSQTQNTLPILQQQDSTALCKDKLYAPKRNFSCTKTPTHVKDGQEICDDHPPAIPLKIPRATSCKKVSLSQAWGSLDKFRRKYCQSEGLKPSTVEGTKSSRVLHHGRVPQIDGTAISLENVPSCQKDEEESDVAETHETQGHFKSPPTFSTYTSLKCATVQSKSNMTSLAAKLCHLKQKNKAVTQNTLPHCTGVTPVTATDPCYSNDDTEDTNNNNKPRPCDTQCIPNSSKDCELTEGETDVASDDWLHHYDNSVGKVVYINKVTGLSRYGEPSVEETQVHCTSDITNMAVSVVSKTGIEYRCYPFQMDVVFPFVPKSKEDRVISSGSGNGGDAVETCNSLSSMYSEWKNPVFVRPPTVGVDISSEQADGLAVKIHNILFPYRFSKAMVHSMKVINQVDKKFLACLINTQDQDPATESNPEGRLLVLVDQHAAHERVRLENLVADSYEDDPEAPAQRRLSSSTIAPPLEVSVTAEEERLLRSCQPYLRGLGLEMQFCQTGNPRLLIEKVPMCFIEKESNELRRGRQSVIKTIVEEYLREQIELLQSAGRVKGTLPLTVQNVLASLACHGAIKFNHSLSKDECCSLVGSLSECRLPFQCAHGRPSIVPLVDILHLENDQQESLKPNLGKLRRMHKMWKLYGNS